jgi:hypothetical protein
LRLNSYKTRKQKEVAMTEYGNIHKEVKNSTRRDQRILCDEQAKKAVEVVSKGSMKRTLSHN